MENIALKVVNGDRRAVARLITIIEENAPEKNGLLRRIYPHTGHSYVVGITGAPGAGKSTLTNELIAAVRTKGLRVGVLAVDPSSPFSGGAILGDRIRMQGHAGDSGVFIRSMGARGSLGGVSYATAEAVHVLDASGADVIFVETVGVGQSEYEIMGLADTVVLVLTPGMGDAIQAIKAGIMEIADLFAVNKGDLPGADRVVYEINRMLDLGQERRRRPEIHLVSSRQRTGITALLDGIERHRRYQEDTGLLEKRRKKRMYEEMQNRVIADLRLFIANELADGGFAGELCRKVKSGALDLDAATKAITRKVLDKWQEEQNC